ncbi:MAG: response regulator [Bdellovibrionales bacterium]
MQRKGQMIAIDGTEQLTVANNSVAHIKRFNGVVVVFSSNLAEVKKLLYIDKDVRLKDFMKLVFEALNDFKIEAGIENTKNIRAKFIASTRYFSVLEEYFRATKLEYKAKVVEEGYYFEVYYYQTTNKLRISKVGEKSAIARKNKVRVLLVEDSRTIRKILKNLLEADPTFEVVAEAETPSKALKAIERWRPDAITLDINLPEKNGVELLKEYYPKYPIPTVMVTSINITEGTHVLDALESGAIDYIQKPSLKDLEVIGPVLRDKIYVAARTHLSKVRTQPGKQTAIECQLLSRYFV